jgi:hypothetical protein
MKRVEDKIQKLLALAAKNSGATDHERKTALKIIMALMAKHGIEQSKLGDKKAFKARFGIDQSELDGKKAQAPFGMKRGTALQDDIEALSPAILRQVAAGRDTVAKMAVPIAKELGVSDEERTYAQVFPTGKRRPFYRRLRDVAHLLVKVGLLTSPARGKYAITDFGRAPIAVARPKAAE